MSVPRLHPVSPAASHSQFQRAAQTCSGCTGADPEPSAPTEARDEDATVRGPGGDAWKTDGLRVRCTEVRERRRRPAGAAAADVEEITAVGGNAPRVAQVSLFLRAPEGVDDTQASRALALLARVAGDDEVTGRQAGERIRDSVDDANDPVRDRVRDAHR